MSFDDEESLRRMLIRGNEVALQPYFKECEKVSGLFISSLSNLDDCTGYRKISGERSVRFLNLVRRSFSFTTIDCDESIEDPMSMHALTLANKICYCMRPNLQSVAFTAAHENLVDGLHISGKIHAIMNGNRGLSDFSEFKPFGIEADTIQIPYCQGVELNENSGRPFVSGVAAGRGAKRYKASIEQIAGVLADIQGEEGCPAELPQEQLAESLQEHSAESIIEEAEHERS